MKSANNTHERRPHRASGGMGLLFFGERIISHPFGNNTEENSMKRQKIVPLLISIAIASFFFGGLVGHYLPPIKSRLISKIDTKDDTALLNITVTLTVKLDKLILLSYSHGESIGMIIRV
jgi:hypothetical protein